MGMQHSLGTDEPAGQDKFVLALTEGNADLRKKIFAKRHLHCELGNHKSRGRHFADVAGDANSVVILDSDAIHITYALSQARTEQGTLLVTRQADRKHLSPFD